MTATIISYHIISHHIISYHIISYHIISYHIISHHITSHHIIPHHHTTDLIAFTDGLGVEMPPLRDALCSNFAFCGIKIDQNKNNLAVRWDQIGDVDFYFIFHIFHFIFIFIFYFLFLWKYKLTNANCTYFHSYLCLIDFCERFESQSACCAERRRIGYCCRRTSTCKRTAFKER